MFHTCVEGDLFGCLEGLDGCGGNILHLIAGEESAEMERSISEAVGDEPLAHLADHGHIVVDARDDEVSEFDPYVRLFHGENSVEHWLQVSATDALVDLVAEGFQVNIGSIEIRQEISQRLLTDITRCNEDVPESFLMRQTRRIYHIFYIGKGFGVGVGDAWAVVLLTEADDLFRREVVVIHLVRCDLRDVVVLTVQTTEVTARTGEGETGGARMEVVERFLLNGVDGQRTGFGIDLTDEHTVMVTTTATTARLAIRNMAMVRTELALYSVVVQSLIIFTLHQNTIAS